MVEEGWSPAHDSVTLVMHCIMRHLHFTYSTTNQFDIIGRIKNGDISFPNDKQWLQEGPDDIDTEVRLFSNKMFTKKL